MMKPQLTVPEVETIQKPLKSAMQMLDYCGQDDLSEQVKVIFKEVAARCFQEQTVDDDEDLDDEAEEAIFEAWVEAVEDDVS